MTVETLLHVVPTLLKRIANLEKDLKNIKETMGDAIIKLVRKVKKQKGILKIKGWCSLIQMKNRVKKILPNRGGIQMKRN